MGTWDALCVQLSSHDLAHVSSRWQSWKTDDETDGALKGELIHLQSGQRHQDVTRVCLMIKPSSVSRVSLEVSLCQTGKCFWKCHHEITELVSAFCPHGCFYLVWINQKAFLDIPHTSSKVWVLLRGKRQLKYGSGLWNEWLSMSSDKATDERTAVLSSFKLSLSGVNKT